VGTIEGGTAANIVPELCRFIFELRNLPGVDPDGIFAAIERYAQETLVPEMRATSPKAGVEFERLVASPALEASEAAALTQLVRRLTRDGQVRKVGYGTEAGLFQEAGVPAIVCGPGDIAVAHRPDEFVELAQIAACEAFLDRVVETLRAPGPLG
jgi:acetylornithine deacetylase